MSVDAKKATVRRVLEALIAGDLAVLDEHPGYWQTKQYFPAFFAGFADLRVVRSHALAEGDAVALRATLQGTHQGEFMGIAATGKPVSFDIFSIDQFDGDRIVEHNATADLIGILGQLGALAARPGRE